MPGPTPRPIAWPGRAGRWLGLLVLLVLAGGCAEPLGAEGADAARAPATVTVSPADRGKTVDLTVGDRLIVDLRQGTQPARLGRPWRLQLSPTTVLRRIADQSSLTRVVLAAEAPGTVQLLLVQQSCGPPLRCPMAPPAGQSERMHRPNLALAITVRVR